MSSNQDLISNHKVEISSNKSFGIVFSIFFLLIFFYSFFYNQVNFIFLYISFFFVFITLFKPIIFHYPNLLWSKIGIIIGLFISPIVMLLIYTIVFIPTGIIFKLLRIDLLDRKINKNLKSYWKARKESMQNFKNQF